MQLFRDCLIQSENSTLKEMDGTNMETVINSHPAPIPSQPSLLDLNDDCLLELFSHLTLDDLIITSIVCSRFEYIAIRLFPRRVRLWKDFSENDNTRRFVLSEIGNFLTEVECNNSVSGSGISIQETMDLIQKNCENLEKIILVHTVPDSLLTLPSNIRSINISFPENWNFCHNFFDGLRKYKSLDSLSLKFYYFTQIDSTFLTELPSLTHLQLKNCSVEPMDLYKCLQKSEIQLQYLSLGNCSPRFPNTLIDEIDHLSKLNRLDLRLNCVTLQFDSSNLFKHLTSLKLSKSTSNIDVDNLFIGLVKYNMIETLSLNLLENTKSLKRSTLKELHRLTKLQRLFIYESDYATDEFLMEISKSMNLTHFVYRQTYKPVLSLDAIIAFIVNNGPKLQVCRYTIYHDIYNKDDKSQQKRELIDVFRKTIAFRRILQCKEDISCTKTSCEFLFKKFKSTKNARYINCKQHIEN